MDEQKLDELSGMQLANARFQEHYARSHVINRSTVELAEHEDGNCTEIHPGYSHDSFEELPTSERMSAFYGYEVQLARRELSDGNINGAIDRCEKRLLRWWPFESRALEILEQALTLQNRSWVDHYITSIYGSSWRYSSRTLKIRRVLDPWLFWVIAGGLALFFLLWVYFVPKVSDEFANTAAGIFFKIFAGLIITKIALRFAPDPELWHGHWSARTDWGDQHCPWDFQTWRAGQWW